MNPHPTRIPILILIATLLVQAAIHTYFIIAISALRGEAGYAGPAILLFSWALSFGSAIVLNSISYIILRIISKQPLLKLPHVEKRRFIKWFLISLFATPAIACLMLIVIFSR